MLKFNKDGDFQYVIVDDWLPMTGDRPAFAHSHDNVEIWPAIIEKAYAKLYGSYSAINEGKVHMAMADMVENGFPEELTLASFKNNLALFTNMLRNLDKNGALLGCGSHNREGGDNFCNEEGIVYNHAYAIIDVA